MNRVDDVELYDRVYRRMGEFIERPEVQEAYDLVIFDTPPALESSLPESAVLASTHLLIPAQMDPQCVEGLPSMLSMWMKANANRGANRIELIGIVINMYVSNLALHKSMLHQISDDPNLGPFVLQEKLSRRGAYAESDHEALRPTSVLGNRKSDPARREAEALCARVLTAMGLSYEPTRIAA